MESQQRFLRRRQLMGMFDQILREAAYHKKFDEDEALELIPVWSWDDEEGESANPL